MLDATHLPSCVCTVENLTYEPTQMIQHESEWNLKVCAVILRVNAHGSIV